MSTPTSVIPVIPGDPDEVRRISAQLATVEVRAREIESRLRAIETGVGPQMWRGQAADGFAALLGETGPDLTRLAASYGAASQALATYATELEAAQAAAHAAAAEASTAAGDRDRARADRDSADADAFQHAAAADEARVQLDAARAQDAEQRRTDALGRVNAASAALDQAEQAMRAAQQKADQAASQREAAAARCIRELDDVSSVGIDSRQLDQTLAASGGLPRTAGVEPVGLDDSGLAEPGVIAPPATRGPGEAAAGTQQVVEGSRSDAVAAAVAMTPLAAGLGAASKLGREPAREKSGPHSGEAGITAPQADAEQHGLEPAGEPGGYRYTLGRPTRPVIAFDDDFVFDPNAEATSSDYLSWEEWGAKLFGAPLLRPDLDDALELYGHYRDGTGTPVVIDYEEAYSEDRAVRDAVDSEIATAMQWAELIHQETGQSSFSISGDAAQSSYYPETENWQKALGGYTIWGSGDVQIEGNIVTMEVTIHAEDRYNFNRGESDIATGTPDEANGRFAELGWAKSFDVSGSITRTVTWELGSDLSPVVQGGEVDRTSPGEDRIDGRSSGR